MKPLLDPSSPTYQRRLVRELNSQPDGFYGDAYPATKGHPIVERVARIRCNLARYSGGVVWVRQIGGRWHVLQSHPWDVNGREIVASRQA